MKFEHVLNSFNPTVTQVDLTEKRFLCKAESTAGSEPEVTPKK